MTSFRRLTQCAGSTVPSAGGVRDALRLHRGTLHLRRRRFPLSLIAYNTAFLPLPLYTGTNRVASEQAFIDQIRASGADVVGLSELFNLTVLNPLSTAEIREEIKDAFGGEYDVVLGPRGVRTDFTATDSGLVLLTKLPVLDVHRFAFNHVAGGLGEGDEWASKGVLHVRVELSDGTPCDLFLAHTQSVYSSDRSGTWAALRSQLSDVGWFVKANRHPEGPALLLGDLNVNSWNEAQYAEMMPRLGDPVDLWKVVHGDADGFTYNDGNDFTGEAMPGGDRLDYVMHWPGTRLVPFPTSMEVLKWKADGRDASDHFGLRIDFEEAWQVEPEVDGPIAAVEARMSMMRALRETASGGGGYANDWHESDEVKLFLTLSDAHGNTAKTESRTGNVDTGDTMAPGAHDRARLEGDPGSQVKLHLRGKELDSASDDEMGTSHLWISREDLLASGGRPIQRVMPRLTKGGGDYAVEVEVRAE